METGKRACAKASRRSAISSMMFYPTVRIAIMALLAISLFAFTAASGVSAASGTWTAVNGGTWDDSANWSGGVIADGAGFTAGFIFDANANPTTITLNSSRTIGHVQVGDSLSTFRHITITPATSQTITFDNNGNGATLTHGGGNTGGTNAINTINTGLILADNLTIARNNNGAARFLHINGSISESGGARSVIHTGVAGSTATLISGVNSYTGNTSINSGAITFSSTGELRFVIQDGNTSNRVQGGGTATFNGLFRLDVSSLTASAGVWNLVDVTSLTETFHTTTFGLAFVGGPAFTNDGGGIYTNGDWTFNTATGNLTLIPEPGTIALLFAGGVLMLTPRRKSV
jgi:autotransporter-associated beta strand protein